MSDLILGLVPDYGLYVVSSVVVLACLAVPLPASMLVLAAGSFAAAGDLTLWQVILSVFVAFIIGDQLAFLLARRAGPPLLTRARRFAKLDVLISRSEDLLQRRGRMAVLLSHTVVSPTCPYVSYLCGAGGMGHASFTGTAVVGAVLWTAGYVGLGYVFADQLAQITELLSNFFGFVIAGIIVVVSALWLKRQWQNR